MAQLTPPVDTGISITRWYYQQFDILSRLYTCLLRINRVAVEIDESDKNPDIHG